MSTRIDLTRLSRPLMGIWAHPGDEAHLSAGLMAGMADAGRPVTVLTMTRSATEAGRRLDGVDLLYATTSGGIRRLTALEASTCSICSPLELVH